jgi:peptide/nickel transport system substrate-binding protein
VPVRLEFRILGPLEVLLDGVPIRIGGPRQRALLALLLSSANRVVSRDRLIEELLRDQPVEAADRALRVQVSRLRKVFASHDRESRLVARPPGYLLRVEPGELDLHTFEQLAVEGRLALEEGDPAAATAKLREAEALWRGRPLADLEFEPFARVEVERLDELRLTAVEDRIEAELQLGRHGALVAELETLVVEHPLRERLQTQLMLALYRSGRQADALEAYRTMRSLLVDELALEPSPKLRELERAILRQDAGLELLQPGPGRVATAVLAPAVAQPAPAGRVADAPSSSRRGARLRLLALALGAAGAAAAAIVIPLETGGSARLLPPLDGNGLVLVSDRSGALRADVPLDAAPADVAKGVASLWVSEPDAGRVVRVDPHNRALMATIPVGRGPIDVASGAGDVWVVNTLDGTVSRIDPGSDTVTQTITVGSNPSAVVVSAGSVWVASRGDGTVWRVDPSTGRIEGAIKTGRGPSALAGSDKTLWVANDESGTVSRVDTRTHSVTDTIHVGDAPSAIAVTRAGVWVLDRLDATLSRIDPVRDVVTSTFPLVGAPSGLAVTNGAVWVADERAGTLIRLDPHGDGITRRSTVGGRPQALATSRGLWAAVGAGGTGHRGGTLDEVATHLDTLDPASSQSNNSPPTQIPGLLNDGLVTLDHVAGAEGARLVPDLAVSLPTPTDGGRTYLFRLRLGIRYSTGGLVRPTDVRHSFERLFELGSSGTTFYDTIVGAPACSHAGKRCDLSRGIVADDAANTVTFHLTRPDPDFIYKLTISFADVLPASTPAHESHGPLAATGPYMVSSYVPGRELTLVRNPYFREWSAAAQPDGYADRLVMRLIGPHPALGAALVAKDRSDFMSIVGGLPANRRDYFLLHQPGQAHINPSMNTGQLALNVHAAPFNDVRVRRALNLALDRARIVSADGGPAAARPTCQILPPRIPGYQRYCPYTRDKSSDGRWRGPDIARARRLVAASGTAGMRVAVWDSPEPQFAVNEGRATVAALEHLGYRATLHLLPDQRLYDYANDSRNHAQVIDGGTSADYPSADDFFSGLTCRAFVPGNGRASEDSAEFCDPAIDKEIARVAALQTTDTTAAEARWVRLDRQLTNRAIWLPTVTPDETDLVSTRVGNYQYNPVWGPLVDQLWVR